MELPLALDTALKSLLTCHQVSSWKIVAENQNSPVIILRLKADSRQSACQNGERAETVAFRRKQPCQIQRDRRRAEEHRQRRDNVEKMTDAEERVQNKRENPSENVLNTDTTEKVSSENQNKTGSSVIHTSQDSATGTTQREARGSEQEKEPETATVTRDEVGGHEHCMETDTENKTETSSESDTDSNTKTKVTESEADQLITNVARKLVREAELMQYTTEELRKIQDSNDTFCKVVLDWRCRGAPSLLCISPNVFVNCDINTRKIGFELRDPWDSLIHYWHHWPDVDRDGAHKEMIEKALIEMKKVLNRIQEII